MAGTHPSDADAPRDSSEYPASVGPRDGYGERPFLGEAGAWHGLEPGSAAADAVQDTKQMMIVNLGRGPEIAGTRITIYRVMDFVRDDSKSGEIASELDLTEEQVGAALQYIASHRDEVEAQYEKILSQTNEESPPLCDDWKPAEAKDFLRMIRERRAGEGAHDRAGGQ